MTTPRTPVTRLGARAATAALLAVALLLSGCSRGDAPTATELSATFDDVRHLAPRHAVRVADVRVGTVRSIELDGFRARVTLEVDPEHRVPRGTTAAIRQSSLLGENFVELRYPADVDPREAPTLSSGDVIEDTSTVVELEDLARRATEVISAISAADIDAILEAASEGIGGRGDQLGELLERTADLSTTYAARSEEVGAVLDDLARLGGDLAEGRDDIAGAIEEAERAAATLVRQRDRTLTALEGITDLATTTDAALLGERADRLSALLADLRPVTARLADERGRLVTLLAQLERFVTIFPDVVPDDLLQVYGQIRSPSGGTQPIIELLEALLALEEAAP